MSKKNRTRRERNRKRIKPKERASRSKKTNFRFGILDKLAVGALLCIGLYAAGSSVLPRVYDNFFGYNESMGAPLKSIREFGDYGHVVYERNVDAPHKLYIVTQAHRDPRTHRMPRLAAETQMNVYRILHKIIGETDTNLVLSEGDDRSVDIDSHFDELYRFNRQDLGDNYDGYTNRLDTDDEYLVDQIINSPESVPTSLPYFYLSHPDIVAQGYEHPDAHRMNLEAAKNYGKNDQTRAFYHYMLKVRSCTTLTLGPKRALEVYKEGKSPNVNAAILIGDGHVSDLIKYLDTGRCDVHAIESNSDTIDITTPLGLDGAGYAVTIIRPNTLHYP